jgi:hypothetical protein
MTIKLNSKLNCIEPEFYIVIIYNMHCTELVRTLLRTLHIPFLELTGTGLDDINAYMLSLRPHPLQLRQLQQQLGLGLSTYLESIPQDITIADL